MKTISQIETAIKTYIVKNAELQNISLVVEVSEIRGYQNMLFLRIRDQTGTLPAIIYGDQMADTIKTGDKLNVTGNLSMYHNNLQLIIKSYDQAGMGDQNAKLIILKKKFQKLGYFDNKPELDIDHVNIGIISAINSAAIHDFIYTINNRCYKKCLYIYPATVQGTLAPKEIIDAITLANNHNAVTVLALIRGGGSKEDLECFNDENLAKVIYQSKIPIVTGIGHQIDTSLADMVAVKNYITPTSVAQHITTEKQMQNPKELFKAIEKTIIGLMNARYEYLTSKTEKLEKYSQMILDSIKVEDQAVLKKKMLIIANRYYDYIINSSIIVYEAWQVCLNNTTKIIESHNAHLTISKVKLAQSLEKYDSDLRYLTQPRITMNNKPILSLSEFVENKKYVIHFIDGDYHLKI